MIYPMLCRDGNARDLERTDMVAELKAEGTRGLIIKHGNDIRIQNRRGIDYTIRLPELTEEAKQMEVSFVIDGEIVWIDERGLTVFLGSQRRCATTNPAKIRTMMRQYPITFLAFDLIEFEGINQRSTAYQHRKTLLQLLVNCCHSIQYLPCHKDSRRSYETVMQDGGEGVVLKRLDSTYQDGIRSWDWLKIKRGYL